MERWVYENLKKKNFSTLLASAAETAQTLSGDCTEHSVLLVGMARAKKIPARAVVGLLYVPALNAFGGHMWSEVHVNGQWVPLDATLGKGFAAAERIKFGETSFAGLGNAPLEDFLSMAATLGNLRIEVLEAE
jgi:transglutaminase-like putative cysteine protease